MSPELADLRADSYASARASKSILHTLHGMRRASFHVMPSPRSSVQMCVYGRAILSSLGAGFFGVGGSGSKQAPVALVDDDA